MACCTHFRAATPWLAADDLDRARCLLASYEVLAPATPVDSGIDEFGSGIRLVPSHANSCVLINKVIF